MEKLIEKKKATDEDYREQMDNKETIIQSLTEQLEQITRTH